jgi:predicted RNase H-like HicB family nuclease
MSVELTAVFQQVPEGFIAFVEELPGANAQGATQDEARSNLQEAVTLVLEANRALSEQALTNAPVIRERFHLSA